MQGMFMKLSAKAIEARASVPTPRPTIAASVNAMAMVVSCARTSGTPRTIVWRISFRRAFIRGKAASSCDAEGEYWSCAQCCASFFRTGGLRASGGPNIS
jgi:lysylphosphatidylglycerol synthetase-like protein (DUF2156 family)